MANTDASQGFRPVDNMFGGGYTGRLKKVAFAAGDSTAAFKGSLVKYTGASLDSDGKVPVVTLASPSDTKLAGAVVSLEPQRAGNWNTYHRAASTEVIAYIPADPKTLYQCQEDSVGGNISPSTGIGQNVNFTAESGSTVTGMSTMELDSSTAADTAALPIRLESVVERSDIDGTSSDSNATWIVSINQTAELNTTGT